MIFDSLNLALEIIAKIGTLYNQLERSNFFDCRVKLLKESSWMMTVR